jgi:hypothetical protein
LVVRALSKNIYNFCVFGVVLVGFVAFVSVGTFLLRPLKPDTFELPTLPFFVAYSLLPCFFSLALIKLASSRHLIIRILAFLTALFVFWLLWILQLRLPVDLSLTLSDIRLSSAFGNFVVFTSELMDSAVTIAAVFLAILSLTWRWLSRQSALTTQ